MSHIYVTDLDGREHKLEAKEGWRVMEIIRESGLPMKAECGGCCQCATCHVAVDPAWLERLDAPSEDERGMLDFVFEIRETSRLACQISYRPALAGLRVTLVPDPY